MSTWATISGTSANNNGVWHDTNSYGYAYTTASTCTTTGTFYLGDHTPTTVDTRTYYTYNTSTSNNSGTWYTLNQTFTPIGHTEPVHTEQVWRFDPSDSWHYGELEGTYRIIGESNEEYKDRIDNLHAEQRERFEKLRLEREKELKEERLKFQKAQEKSIKLLKDWLSPSEYNYLMEKGELEIPSQINEDEIWIVKREPTARVMRKKKGKLITEHCILPSINVPDGDILLSKIVLLKTNEEQFTKISNISYVAAYQ